MSPAPTPTRAYGTWPGGMPYLAVGSGPPLVFLPGTTPNHEAPVGVERRFHARQVMPYAGSRRVWWVNRRPGLDPAATMADIAADYANAMLRRFDEPVDVIGESTGGSVALQLAADHPAVVKRLVIVSAAYRLSEEGRDTMMRVADHVLDGRPRAAGAELMRMTGSGALSNRLLAGLGWLVGKPFFARVTADLMTTIRAEDGFNLHTRLADILAPTLLIGGDRDAFYSAELFRQTAEGIPRAHLALYSGRGHMNTALDPRFLTDVLTFLDPPDDAGSPAGPRYSEGDIRPTSK
ncbi:alpha/beta hydrolase [Cryobacterium adonitolivorans]|uniref:Alpha/beta hydrolase n=1 Tax=Cryobacterium adonitolivorans TaxID=1259189 RepID=A0A4R8WD84_9MICO|nr:alpha/beta hydrolase [Cryobacterium adonitolivorans]TFC06501.1 alpha/beta hydrolase [Cryobacterium adonitolivorans]